MFDDQEVSVELVSGYLTVKQPREIAMYAQVFGELSQVAVFGSNARALIASAIAATGEPEPLEASVVEIPELIKVKGALIGHLLEAFQGLSPLSTTTNDREPAGSLRGLLQAAWQN